MAAKTLAAGKVGSRFIPQEKASMKRVIMLVLVLLGAAPEAYSATMGFDLIFTCDSGCTTGINEPMGMVTVDAAALLGTSVTSVPVVAAKISFSGVEWTTPGSDRSLWAPEFWASKTNLHFGWSSVDDTVNGCVFNAYTTNQWDAVRCPGWPPNADWGPRTSRLLKNPPSTSILRTA